MKELVTLNCCWLTAQGLSSVTTTVTVLVDGPCASVGVQEIAPEDESIVIPAGGETRLKVKLFAGMSGSVAEADTFNGIIRRLFAWREP